MKKKNCFFGCLLVLMQVEPLVAGNAYVTFNLKDGKVNSFLLSDTPQINYSSDKVNVKGPVDVSFALDEVIDYHFTDSDLTAVPLLSCNEVRVSYIDNNQVKVQGLSADQRVAIYNPAGTLVAEQEADADGVVEIVLPQVSGIYLLRTNSQIVKLIKK